MSTPGRPANPYASGRPNTWLFLSLIAAVFWAGCSGLPAATGMIVNSPTRTPTAARTTLPPLPTATPTPLSPTPTATTTPARTSTPTPEWRYWPNMSDLRQIAVWKGDLWIAALSGLVWYQPESGQWDARTAVDGLKSSTCESVLAWHGQIWVGTPEGIARYRPDEDAWYVYGRVHGLPGTHNSRLYVDPDTDTLWMGSLEGLAAYDPAADRWLEQTDQDLPFEQVTSLVADSRALWIVARHGPSAGIWRFDKASRHWQSQTPSSDPGPYTLVSTPGIWAIDGQGVVHRYTQSRWHTVVTLETRLARPLIAVYHDSELWLATDAGWLFYNLQTGQTTSLRYPQGNRPVAQGAPVWTHGQAWIPTQSGLLAFDRATQTWQRPTPDERPLVIQRVLLATDGGLLVDAGDQVNILQPHTGSWHPLAHPAAGLEHGSPQAASHPDRPDIWFYSPPIGVPGKSGSGTIWHYSNLDAAPEPIAMPLELAAAELLPLVDQERLWVFSEQTLSACAIETGEWVSYSLALPTGPWFHGAQESGAIWLIAADGNLIRFDTQTTLSQTWLIPFDHTWRLLALTPDSVWLGGESNILLEMDRSSGHWRTQPLDPACAGARLTVLEAQGSTLWAAGEHGIIRYVPWLGQEICCTTQAGMMDNWAEQIVPWRDEVWFVHSWRGLWGRTWPETRP